MCDVGIIGLGVIGNNLALNMVSNGYRVSLYNRTYAKAEEFYKWCDDDTKEKLEVHSGIGKFTMSLKTPRVILIVIQAGSPVDSTIGQLRSGNLASGDIVIDGGNSHFLDTERRIEEFKGSGLFYMGLGISGGGYGARYGPCMMASGNVEAWRSTKDMLLKVSADGMFGNRCAEFLGERGEGHFVKMVHNSIEYCEMEVIGEVYGCLKAMGRSFSDIKRFFSMKEGESERKDLLWGYLFEITTKILDTHSDILDVVEDSAEQKGTGKATLMHCVDQGQYFSMLSSSVFSRILSNMKKERETALGLYGNDLECSEECGEDALFDALIVAKIVYYSQGLDILHEKGIDTPMLCRLWSGGCILKGNILRKILDSLGRKEQNTPYLCLIFQPYFGEIVKKRIRGLRSVCLYCVKRGIACPSLLDALSYIDQLKSKRLNSVSLIQLQRDYFGGHGFRRTDMEGTHHICKDDGETNLG